MSEIREWTRWHTPQKRLMPKELASWLTDTGSLTRRLQQHNTDAFSVHVLGNCWMRALPDECQLLGVPMTQMAFQREVRLMDGDTAKVYARTVVPLHTFQAMKHRFNSLGNRPLGELLFTEPTVKRGPIEIACLKPGQWLYEMAVLEENSRPDELWGRRSHFYLGGKILLVNEIFLPTLMESM
ncbi:MAG: chorismate lyase [Methylophaga sp.]|nr:chorismate lyase [Methylophaga sp.]